MLLRKLNKTLRDANRQTRLFLLEHKLRRACPLTKAALNAVPTSDLIYSLNISERFKYVYVDNPKTGCSSLKSSLIELELRGRTDERNPYDWKVIHNPALSPLLSLTDLGGNSSITHLIEAGYIFLTFVRNPYTRILSAYKNRILLNQKQKHNIVKQMGINAATEEVNITFSEFVDAVISQSDYEMDPHWRTQTTQILFNLLPYRFIGRFELYQDSYRETFEALGISGREIPDIRHLSSTQGHQTRCGDWFSDDIRRKIYNRFKIDFENFGYSEKLP